MPKMPKNGSQVQLTLLHEHSVFLGLDRTSQGTEVLPCGQGFSGAAQLIPRTMRPRTENDISLGLEKHMVSQKRLNWNFVLSFY